MATHALRLRRTLHLTSTILNHGNHFSSVVSSVAAPPAPSSSSYSASATRQNPNPSDAKPNFLPFRFVSSRDLSTRSRFSNNDESEISPDAILFEGCDYNHWLITMDFPKDPAPTPEEMVDAYVKTAATILGSEEEAKKKIYACSTTTYHGFQVEVSEEVSEKFKGLPGVVFVLPDSYIDPVNKEYGGDKYINGTIIPRPPPILYGRQSGRYNDRNREYNRSPRGQQNYGARSPMNNVAGGQNNYQGDRRGQMPSYQGNYNQGDRGNYNPPGQTVFPPRDPAHAQPEQRDFRGEGRNFAPPQGGGGSYGYGQGGNYGPGAGEQYGQGGGGSYGPGAGENYRQGTAGQYGQGGGGVYGPGRGGNYSQGGGGGYVPGTGGNYGQGGVGSYGQGTGGNYGQGTNVQHGQGGVGSHGQGGMQNFGQGVGGSYGQGIGSGYRQTPSQNGENPSFPQVEQQNNLQGDLKDDFEAANQGRY